MLETGRYTWRHNNLVNFIVNNVDKKFTGYTMDSIVTFQDGKHLAGAPFPLHYVSQTINLTL